MPSISETQSMKLYVPGEWRCAKCDFRLTKNFLSASTGTVHADTSTPEKCPNCDVPMWRVSWEEDCRDAWHFLEREMVRTRQLEKQLHDEGIQPDPPYEGYR
ncbi:hypothetical protein [uncultured Roseobacter sp.]|uniref:hypothetical protein n=1 Tax=uncultured Roseobacter sp. TaxID=114847 RepID=UPI00261D2BAE|nr:hypothetical protein [uncultured Roseobacter sp.]